MITFKRTNSLNPDFIQLVKHLDAELAITDGEDHSFYNQFNKLHDIRYVILAFDDKIAVGCGAIKVYNSVTMEVKRMYVADGHRGKGIAGDILIELETWAKELGFSRCILETGTRQDAAIVLYKKSGYRIIPNYGQYAGVENSLCFEKMI
ncbi:GNAT family N-acetyltransferase [Cyclobacteriaceae bacterium YHN15]|jgi:putative acetyltransferase|nr:GNAT family N-acetyltransferase [Cyclobacteriaceae bacterium YHN15]